jgi:hypothetical protein
MKIFPPTPTTRAELITHLIRYGILPLVIGVALVYGLSGSGDLWLLSVIIVIIIGIVRCGVIFYGGGGTGIVITLFLAIFIGWIFTLLYIVFGFIYTVVDIIKLFVVRY